MTEENIKQFCEWYNFIDNRAEEFVNCKHPSEHYEGFEIQNGKIKVNFYHYEYGECYDGYDILTTIDLDDNTEMKKLYAKELLAYKIEKEKQTVLIEKQYKEAARKKIEQLKKQYGL